MPVAIVGLLCVGFFQRMKNYFNGFFCPKSKGLALNLNSIKFY